jgi:FkbM family methyltransferase
VEPGWDVNWLGVRTRVSVQSEMHGYDVPTFVRTEPPESSEDAFEWVDVLESVCESEGSFTMVELGAGWGRWIVNAAAALRQIDPERPILLVGVEAEPTHFEWLRRHLADNGIDPDRQRLIRAAVAARNGWVKFQRGDAAGWYGQAIERDDPAAKLSGPVSRLIRWTRNSAANRLAVGPDARRTRRVRAVTLASLLEPLDRVDLVDADVQGVEADVLESAADQLAAKVRRVHVGTHGPENERRVRALFEQLGWECRFDYAGQTTHDTPFGPVAFEDGVQSWVNPARRPRG